MENKKKTVILEMLHQKRKNMAKGKRVHKEKTILINRKIYAEERIMNEENRQKRKEKKR